MSAFVPIARVVKPHGLQGELSVIPAGSGDLRDLIGVEVWFVPPPESVRAGEIVGVREGPKGPLLRVEGVHDVEAAGELRGANVVAAPGSLPPEWPEMQSDPIGYRVVAESEGPLGEIRDVIVTGANDVWVVDGGPLGEVLIPVIEDVVLDLDESTETVRVRLLPGLIQEDD